VERNLAFRGWFYFRTGWATYFAFIVAAVNALTVTFFLAVENYPLLNSIFPTFFHYVAIVGGLGVPLLVLVGYIHFKKSKSFKAEQDVLIETSPHIRRILVNTEVLLPSYLKLLELMLKLSQNEKLSQEDLEHISELKNQLDDHIKQRQVN
jgi:uncharacterized membrane protein required for colicin V production|tara:strand:- start:588 stop:1040 length:453 start_codon:yes stop_codon:yes gene_type:complete